MPVNLTNRLVASALPRDRPYEIRDTRVRGLLLRVQPTGYKVWNLQWAQHKRKTLGPLGHLTLDQAREIASRLMAEVIRDGIPGIAKTRKPPALTLGEFLDDRYAPWAASELRSGPQQLVRLRTAFADLLTRPLARIDAARIEAWQRQRLSEVNARSGQPIQRATMGREFAALRAALGKAVEWGLLDANPLKGIRLRGAAPRKVVRYLSPDEETRLRAALASRDRSIIDGRASGNRTRAAAGQPLYPALPMGGFGDHLTPVVLLAMNTGLRKSELLSLEWTDIDLERKLLTVRRERAKSGKARHVPLNGEAMAVLTKWKAQQPADGAVFRVKGVREH